MSRKRLYAMVYNSGRARTFYGTWNEIESFVKKVSRVRYKKVKSQEEGRQWIEAIQEDNRQQERERLIREREEKRDRMAWVEAENEKLRQKGILAPPH